MTTQIVYVAGYEGNNKLATSQWLWFKGKQDADDHYNELKKDLEPLGAIVYKGEVQVTNTENELITDEVEKFLEENDWENAFKAEAIS
jgi:hypothetical protein